MKQTQIRPMRRYALLLKKHTTKKVVLHVVVLFIAAVILAQLVYPYDRGLPLANVAGESVRLATHDELAKVVTEKFDATKVKITVGNDKQVEFELKAAGAELNTEATIERLTRYPLWLRFIPGSFLFQADKVAEADVYYTNQPFKEFINAKSGELSFSPQNARLAIKDGHIDASEAIEGSHVDSEALLQVVSNAHLVLGGTTTIEAPARRLPASKYSRDLESVRTQAEAALTHTVTIKIDTKTFSPAANDLASWILIADDKDGKTTLAIDKARIKAYLDELNKEVGTPAGQTNIAIVDGREVGRTPGATGRALASDTMAEQIATQLLTSAQAAITLDGQFVPTQPSIIFNNKYTATQAGLQAYVDDVARSKNVHIQIQQLNGQQWFASARATESIPSGSTYKLFVAMVLFDRIDKGEIHWDDPMLDTTVAGCFDRMTVASTNPCAEAWIAQFGRQYINDFVHARGFSDGTSFTTGSANQTTAADLSKYMMGLNDSSLVNGTNRDRLLNNLGRHPYRYGIPTGSQGQVHDKVGFLWDYVHDTAIVQHPRGTYIMTIMTKGQSYATIAAITREVERIMYP